MPADGRGDCWTAAVEGDGHEIEPEGLLEHFAGEIAGGPEPGMGVAVLTRAGFHSQSPPLPKSYIRSIQGLRSAPEVERRLRRDALPVIGHIPIRELHRRDVTRVIDGKASAPIAARRVFEDIRAMIRWAVSRGDLDHNPLDGMNGPPTSKPRDRVLSDDEIRELWLGKSLA